MKKWEELSSPSMFEDDCGCLQDSQVDNGVVFLMKVDQSSSDRLLAWLSRVMVMA